MTLQASGRLAAWPVRRKLLAMVLLPLVGVLPLLGLVLLVWGNAALDRLLITKVRSDLAVAHGYFDRVLGEVAASTGAVADSQALYAALQPVRAATGQTPGKPAAGLAALGGDRAALQALLARFKDREGLDFINLRAPDGQLLLADFDGASDGPAVLAAPGPAARTSAAVVVLSPAAQGTLSPALRQRVAVPLVATQQALPTGRGQEDRAMVVRADAPVLSPDGRVLAWVQAGVLLNRNLPFIDHINGIVYPEGALPFGSQGTATLFLDDVRISTNVRLFDAVTLPTRDAASTASGAQGAAGAADTGNGEQRAIGTRVSRAVRDAVLGRGDTWLDRAFVVNDWYVSAYQPLSDASGQRVGMLYVGYLERPFTWAKYSVLAGIGAVFFAVMIVRRSGPRGARAPSSGPLSKWRTPCGRSRAARWPRGSGLSPAPMRSAHWPATSTTCSTRWPTTPPRCSAGTPSWMPRWPSARWRWPTALRRWRRHRPACCGLKKWPLWASSPPASRTR